MYFHSILHAFGTPSTFPRMACVSGAWYVVHSRYDYYMNTKRSLYDTLCDINQVCVVGTLLELGAAEENSHFSRIGRLQPKHPLCTSSSLCRVRVTQNGNNVAASRHHFIIQSRTASANENDVARVASPIETCAYRQRTPLLVSLTVLLTILDDFWRFSLIAPFLSYIFHPLQFVCSAHIVTAYEWSGVFIHIRKWLEIFGFGLMMTTDCGRWKIVRVCALQWFFGWWPENGRMRFQIIVQFVLRWMTHTLHAVKIRRRRRLFNRMPSKYGRKFRFMNYTRNLISFYVCWMLMHP